MLKGTSDQAKVVKEREKKRNESNKVIEKLEKRVKKLESKINKHGNLQKTSIVTGKDEKYSLFENEYLLENEKFLRGRDDEINEMLDILWKEAGKAMGTHEENTKKLIANELLAKDGKTNKEYVYKLNDGKYQGIANKEVWPDPYSVEYDQAFKKGEGKVKSMIYAFKQRNAKFVVFPYTNKHKIRQWNNVLKKTEEKEHTIFVAYEYNACAALIQNGKFKKEIDISELLKENIEVVEKVAVTPVRLFTPPGTKKDMKCGWYFGQLGSITIDKVSKAFDELFLVYKPCDMAIYQFRFKGMIKAEKKSVMKDELFVLDSIETELAAGFKDGAGIPQSLDPRDLLISLSNKLLENPKADSNEKKGVIDILSNKLTKKLKKEIGLDKILKDAGKDYNKFFKTLNIKLSEVDDKVAEAFTELGKDLWKEIGKLDAGNVLAGACTEIMGAMDLEMVGDILLDMTGPLADLAMEVLSVFPCQKLLMKTGMKQMMKLYGHPLRGINKIENDESTKLQGNQKIYGGNNEVASAGERRGAVKLNTKEQSIELSDVKQNSYISDSEYDTSSEWEYDTMSEAETDTEEDFYGHRRNRHNRVKFRRERDSQAHNNRNRGTRGRSQQEQDDRKTVVGLPPGTVVILDDGTVNYWS